MPEHLNTPLSEPTDPRVEQLLRDAYIQRMRQQFAASETLCRQALELAPRDVQGLELLGDLLQEKGSTEPALELYRQALEVQPGKASLEEKIARQVLLKAEEERERLMAELMLSSPQAPKQRKRNQTAAILLSVICPGGGQFFNGQWVKGAIYLLTGLLCLGLGGPDGLKMLLGMAGPLPRGEEPNGMLAALGMVGGLIWLASLLDASAQASKATKNTLLD
jgi:tetratricopeptide (TPR) repeat protein